MTLPQSQKTLFSHTDYLSIPTRHPHWISRYTSTTAPLYSEPFRKNGHNHRSCSVFLKASYARNHGFRWCWSLMIQSVWRFQYLLGVHHWEEYLCYRSAAGTRCYQSQRSSPQYSWYSSHRYWHPNTPPPAASSWWTSYCPPPLTSLSPSCPPPQPSSWSWVSSRTPSSQTTPTSASQMNSPESPSNSPPS